MTNRRPQPASIAAAAAVVGASMASLASAQSLHDADIVLGLSDANAIAFATAPDATQGNFGQSVFVGQLNANGTGDDPGFDSFTGTFPPGTILSFNIIDALREWDGSAFPESPAPSTMSVFKFGIETESPATLGGFAEGIPFGQADGGGRFHHHLDFELNPDPGTGQLAEGVYLLTLELIPLDQPMLVQSDPLYLVWDFGADAADVAQARDWAIDNLASDPCAADWNGDGAVNILDVVDFINNWSAQGPGADFNEDSQVNILDVIAFIDTFNAGCP